MTLSGRSSKSNGARRDAAVAVGNAEDNANKPAARNAIRRETTALNTSEPQWLVKPNASFWSPVMLYSSNDYGPQIARKAFPIVDIVFGRHCQ